MPELSDRLVETQEEIEQIWNDIILPKYPEIPQGKWDVYLIQSDIMAMRDVALIVTGPNKSILQVHDETPFEYDVIEGVLALEATELVIGSYTLNWKDIFLGFIGRKSKEFHEFQRRTRAVVEERGFKESCETAAQYVAATYKVRHHSAGLHNSYYVQHREESARVQKKRKREGRVDTGVIDTSTYEVRAKIGQPPPLFRNYHELWMTAKNQPKI